MSGPQPNWDEVKRLHGIVDSNSADVADARKALDKARVRLRDEEAELTQSRKNLGDAMWPEPVEAAASPPG